MMNGSWQVSTPDSLRPLAAPPMNGDYPKESLFTFGAEEFYPNPIYPQDPRLLNSRLNGYQDQRIPPNGYHDGQPKQKKSPAKVRFPDYPEDNGPTEKKPADPFSSNFPVFVSVPPKTSKSLPSSRRNSFSKEDLDDAMNSFGPSLLSSLIGAQKTSYAPQPYQVPTPPNNYHQFGPVNFNQTPFHPNDPYQQQYPPSNFSAPGRAGDRLEPGGPYFGRQIREEDLNPYRRDSFGLTAGPASPNIPPQFSDHFLNDDETESVSVGSPAAPSHVKKYLQKIVADSSEFPVLLRRDSIPGMLSASSAALDLAPLPQTRRPSMDGGRGNPEMNKPSSLRRELLTSEGRQSPQNQSPPTDSFGKEMRRARSEEQLNSPKILPISPRFDTPSPTDPLDADSGKNGGFCKFFRQGYCSRGDRCKFPHIAASSPIQEGPQYEHPSSTSPVQSSLPQTTQTPPFPTSNHNSPRSSLNLTPSQTPTSPAFPSNNTPSTASSTINISPPIGTANANTSPPQIENGFKNIKLASPLKKGHKRSTSAPEVPRFPALEQLVGQIYGLCRDQHGCRYLQKKLEEGKEEYVDLIISEISDHLLELMSDPFGNYLCQKLFIYANEQQRTLIATRVASGVVEVSLNMHGTRSVQKLIDCMTTDEQIALVMKALNGNVVKLIKDLNGNHVIQKCLNKLTPAQNQFIYDSVTEHCVEVSSHRHGCCVLQRCIDHASEAQKAQLANEITANALPLVQDAFGNYVVQYVLDLNVRIFSNRLISQFVGHVYPLSLQKFSSNVIEKCIRVAEVDIRRNLIAGILDKEKIPHMLQDAFANYVIQTSLDVAEPDQYQTLVELVRPCLPSIRHLPYCKRVQSKLNRDPAGAKSHFPPVSPQSPLGATKPISSLD